MNEWVNEWIKEFLQAINFIIVLHWSVDLLGRGQILHAFTLHIPVGSLSRTLILLPSWSRGIWPLPLGLILQHPLPNCQKIARDWVRPAQWASWWASQIFLPGPPPPLGTEAFLSPAGSAQSGVDWQTAAEPLAAVEESYLAKSQTPFHGAQPTLKSCPVWDDSGWLVDIQRAL